MCQASVVFAGPRIDSFKCTCADDPADRSPCEHIGPTLLLLKKKMDDSECERRQKMETPWEYPEGELYVTPERVLSQGVCVCVCVYMHTI
jgi:hypothetical protein